MNSRNNIVIPGLIWYNKGTRVNLSWVSFKPQIAFCSKGPTLIYPWQATSSTQHSLWPSWSDKIRTASGQPSFNVNARSPQANTFPPSKTRKIATEGSEAHYTKKHIHSFHYWRSGVERRGNKPRQTNQHNKQNVPQKIGKNQDRTGQ